MSNQKTLSRKQSYMQGILWFILSLIISNLNDIITKYLASNIHPVQISFLRFTFGCIVLLPFMMYFGVSHFKTSRPWVHLIRGLLLFVGISIWGFGLTLIPIASATLLTFTIPFFILLLAPIFLKEKVSGNLWSATIFGFVGVYFVLHPTTHDFNPFSLLMVMSAMLFAILDIINKKFVITETMLSMLFYSALVTATLAALPAYLYWMPMDYISWLLIVVLGAGSNLILYCILKAFSYVKASDVAPFRYLELVLSSVAGVFLFQEALSSHMFIGTLIIVPTTLYIAYSTAKTK